MNLNTKIHKLIKRNYRIHKLSFILFHAYTSLKHIFILNKYRFELINVLNSNLDVKTSEKIKLLDFISQKHYFDFNFDLTFPYDFVKKYNPFNIAVYHDEINNMNYVLHNNKRLYFPKSYGKCLIQNIYNQLLIEQDPDSPHKYVNNNFHVEKGDILIDAGACEGFFALENVENVEKIYLIEANEEWKEPLAKTFLPYKDKVEFVHKFVSNNNQEGKWRGISYITLDKLLVDECNKNIFIKGDIEGFELNLLKGSKKLLQKNNVKLVLCTYHNQFDGRDINNYLKSLGFETNFTKGYMLPLIEEFFNKIEYPYFRKGVIRASKKIITS
ncbi:hypothetical protein MBCUT_11480 [Methanobrevibacter cuticularis]|uniref:Methyltransferase FkbM domain-containing protein n=1 Tax=Methanobrevibacter cuticularis TaxID=47311 RepID=A0A166DW31_9EURY|nr:FkbM family methyltransferase [Methanobrevibacter cuticularis]KZX16012.1 hypothetical protein MBCUT_11480 [Methanobrevibacter cuticularis]